LVSGEKWAGKSTLLRIIAGLQGTSSGQIDFPKDITIGYLPQQMKVNDTTTVINEAISAFSEIMGLAGEIENVISRSGTAPIMNPQNISGYVII